MTADLGIVVVTHRSAHVVGDLLDGLAAALAGLTATVVVVDNASPDNTVEIVRERGDCLLLEAPNAGYAAGINRGVAALTAAGDDLGPVLVLNPDVRLAPGSVPPLLARAARPGVGIVVPRLLDRHGRLVWSLRREPSLGRALGLGRTGHPALSERVTDPTAYDRPQACDWACGAAMLVVRACHDSLGGWDESYFLYSEETDLCLRARDAGWSTWYEPSAIATHLGGQSGSGARLRAMQVLNRVRFYGRRHPPGATLVYHLLQLASELSWLARGERDAAGAVRALLVPSSRPDELGLGPGVVPR